jgi:hypothetical protein
MFYPTLPVLGTLGANVPRRHTELKCRVFVRHTHFSIISSYSAILIYIRTEKDYVKMKWLSW